MDRRRFLAAAATAAGLRAADSKQKLLLPSDDPDDLKFRLMWYSPVPAIDVQSYRLRIGGLVEKPLDLAAADLRRLPQVKQNSRMKCVQCWSARTDWGGFRFETLLDLVKPRKSAKAVRFDCADKWFEYMSLEDMISPRVLLALDMAGKPLADRHGAPLRLIDPSRYGYKCAKLIVSATFVTEGKGSMACDLGPYYSPEGKIQPGYDHPLDLASKEKRKISGGEILEY